MPTVPIASCSHRPRSTGSFAFSVQSIFRNVQYSENVDQFGLFVGTSSTSNFRTGYYFWTGVGGANALAVDNINGVDVHNSSNAQLAPLPDDDLDLELARINGRYFIAFNNLTHPARSGRLSFTIPSFLNSATDLYVGIFAANAHNFSPKVATIDRYTVEVVTPVPEISTLISCGPVALGLLLVRKFKRRSIAG